MLSWLSIQPSPFALRISLGVLLGAVISFALTQSKQRTGAFSPVYLLDAVLLGSLGGLIGARAAYVWLNWDYYQDHVSQAVQIGSGGLAWQGGLLLGLLVVALYALLLPHRPPPAALFDALTPGLALAAVFFWLAAAKAGAAYGRETWPDQGFLWRLSADLPDIYHLYAPRVNVQALGAAWSGLVCGLVVLSSFHKRSSGALFALYLALTGVGGLVLTSLRGDPVPFLWGLRVDWIFDFALTIAGLAYLALSRRRWQACINFWPESV